jgi:hypothetical protein
LQKVDLRKQLTALRPEYLQSHKERLIRQMANVEQREARWHVAHMLPRLRLSSDEREIAFFILLGCLADESRIVKTFSMQALAELAEDDASLWAWVGALLEDPSKTGSPAMRTCGRKLLDRLNEANL